jgi:hypothetical protein
MPLGLVVHICNINALKSIYYANFYSHIKYRILLWGIPSISGKIFTLQKKIIRIMADAQPRTSCKSLIKQLEILPVPCQHIHSLMNLIFINHEIFQTNSSAHSINTRNKHKLHRPHANLSCFQKCTFCAGIKIFNSLPPSLTILKNAPVKIISSLIPVYTHTAFTL